MPCEANFYCQPSPAMLGLAAAVPVVLVPLTTEAGANLTDESGQDLYA